MVEHFDDLADRRIEQPRHPQHPWRQNPETRHIPVMVVTSRAGAKHRERALHEGAADFLVKPVQEYQLVAAVARLAGTAAKLAAQKTVAAGQAG